MGEGSAARVTTSADGWNARGAVVSVHRALEQKTARRCAGTARGRSVRAPVAAASITSPPSLTAKISASAATPHRSGRAGNAGGTAASQPADRTASQTCATAATAPPSPSAPSARKSARSIRPGPSGLRVAAATAGSSATPSTAGLVGSGKRSSAATTGESASAGRAPDLHATTSAACAAPRVTSTSRTPVFAAPSSAPPATSSRPRPE